jgi:hypothetical protein
VILQIDVEVVGPDQVMTGSTAVEVVLPGEAEQDRSVSDSDLANLRIRQRSQALRWGGR